MSDGRLMTFLPKPHDMKVVNTSHWYICTVTEKVCPIVKDPAQEVNAQMDGRHFKSLLLIKPQPSPAVNAGSIL